MMTLQLNNSVKKISLLVSLIFMLLISFAPLSALAVGENTSVHVVKTSNIGKLCASMKEVSKNDETFFRVDLAAKSKSSEVQVFTCDSELKFNKEAFDNGTEKSRKKVMQNLVIALRESPIEDQEQQNIVDQLSAKDSDVSRIMIPIMMDSTSADLYTALKWVSPLLPIVRVIFGIGAIAISLFLIGSTIVDLCFIGLPVMRESMTSNAEGKGGKIPFVSSDAVSVIKETESSADSSGGYKNAYLVYFKRRVVTYIILSICLLYLVLGELSGLISWLLSLGDGIVGGS